MDGDSFQYSLRSFFVLERLTSYIIMSSQSKMACGIRFESYNLVGCRQSDGANHPFELCYWLIACKFMAGLY